jgi:hypothetical protein
VQKVAASDQYARIATGPRGSEGGLSRLYKSVGEKEQARLLFDDTNEVRR